MARLKQISWKEFDKVLLRIGCTFKRQKGSHRVYWKEGLNRPIILPAHTRDLSLRVIKSNLKTLNLTEEQFIELLNEI